MGEISAIIMFDYEASSGIISLIQLYQILEYSVQNVLNWRYSLYWLSQVYETVSV